VLIIRPAHNSGLAIFGGNKPCCKLETLCNATKHRQAAKRYTSSFS